MSDTTTQDQTPQPDSSTPTGGAATSEQPRNEAGQFTGEKSAPWRVPNDPKYPEWAWGKTNEEVLNMTVQLANYVQQQATAPAVQASAQNPPPQEPSVDPNDYVTGRDLDQYVQRYSQSQGDRLEQAAALAASGNFEIVKERNKDIFRRWGPEVQALLNQVPRSAWTIDNLQRAVSMVKANHLDELVEERANRRVEEMGGDLRAGGHTGGLSAGSSKPMNPLESDTVPEAWKKKAADVGLTIETIREFAVAQGMSVDDFFKQFERKIVTEAK